MSACDRVFGCGYLHARDFLQRCSYNVVFAKIRVSVCMSMLVSSSACLCVFMCFLMFILTCSFAGSSQYENEETIVAQPLNDAFIVIVFVMFCVCVRG